MQARDEQRVQRCLRAVLYVCCGVCTCVFVCAVACVCCGVCVLCVCVCVDLNTNFLSLCIPTHIPMLNCTNLDSL